MQAPHFVRTDGAFDAPLLRWRVDDAHWYTVHAARGAWTLVRHGRTGGECVAGNTFASARAAMDAAWNDALARGWATGAPRGPVAKRWPCVGHWSPPPAVRYGRRAPRKRGGVASDPRTYIVMTSGPPQQSKSYGSYFSWGVIDSGDSLMATSRNRQAAVNIYVRMRRELRQPAVVEDSTPVWDADAGRFITWLDAMRKDAAAAWAAADRVAGNRAGRGGNACACRATAKR